MGFPGWIIERLMNRRNARMNAFAVDLLELRQSDDVLEIGFGGGVNLATLIKRSRFVAGVDLSPDVVRRASARFREPVTSGRAVFREGRVESIPFESGRFHKICTVNTLYFWRSLEAGLAELRRVLAQDGQLAIGFLPKQWMDRMGFPSDIFTTRTSEEVRSALTTAGFTRVRIERPTAETAWNVILASR
jgi:SAM-dependent methyltransferase